ncbi:MAG: DUF1385 domain-containing protein [Lachnospiraceae bacterium]|nr:DUF1385 domain-containing protein [Lachnospiraceae bacterium]
MKSSGIGGQAVLEGVMMKNKKNYAVAVRKPDGEIAVEKGESSSVIEKYKFLGVPVVRGVVSFVESLVLGVKMLTSSAAYFDDAEEQPGKFELWLRKKFGEKADKFIMGCTVFLSVVLAVAIFMLLPLLIVSFISEDVISYEWKTLIEGLLRVAIFLGYVFMISRLKDIKRVFMYHGAEHKTINCIEQGMAPTVQNVRECSRLHKRCGTSFLLFVMIISVIFFLLVRVKTLWLRFVVRILFVPVIAGVSYEFIKLAGSSESKVVAVLSKPGLWLQGLTTKEPDDDMIEVAVASVEAVFDWQAYLDENFGSKAKKTKKATKEKSVKAPVVTEAEPELAAAEAKKPVEKPMKKTAKKEVVAEEKVPVKKEEKVEKAKPEKTVTKKEEKEEKPPIQEVEEVAAKFDWSFPSTKKQEPDEAEAKESRSRLAAKVSAADKAEEAGKSAVKNTKPVGRVEEDEEEEDEILRALDKFFVFEGEGTVMERSGNNK